MPKVQSFNCPICGGYVEVSGSHVELDCPHCHNSIHVPERIRLSTGSKQPKLDAIAGKTARRQYWSTYITPLLIMIVASVAGFMVCSSVWRYADSNLSSVIDLPRSASASTPSAAPIARVPDAIPTRTSAPTPKSEIIPPTVATSGNILFQDNFSNPASGWERVNLGNHVADYVENGYRIYIDKSYPRHLTWIGDSYTNISIDVDAKQVAGPDDGLYGVICRAKAGKGSYAFEIASNGSYAIDKYITERVGESIPRLSRGQAAPNLVKPFEFNHITVTCSNAKLALSVNGQSIAQVDDPDFVSGGVGLVVSVGPSSKNGIDVLFSNFVVKGR